MKIYELILAPDEDITMYLNYKIELISTEIGLEPCFIPRKVVYTVKTEDGEYAFCEVQILESNWFNEFKNYCFPISQFEWKKLIREAIENGRSYDLLNKKDIKALDKEFNLDSYMGVPANLLGVCVGCN